jgi:hypothetical protein
MLDPQLLLTWLLRCEAEIQRQAQSELDAHVGDGRARLAYAGMWEDIHGRLPPRIQARLSTRAADGMEHIQDVLIPVGGFHHPTKSECLFELCMLRAEVQHKLHGRGNDEVVARLEELFAMIASGCFVFRD